MVATKTRSRTLNGDEKKNARAGRRLGYRRSFSRGKSTAQCPGDRREVGHPPRRGDAPFGVTGIPDQSTAPAASPHSAAAGVDRRLAEAESRPYIRASLN